MKKYIQTKWSLRTYDVWGNAYNGYDVNDVYNRGEVKLKLRIQIANLATPQEFKYAYPSDNQLKRIFGTESKIITDGDDKIIYVNRDRDCYPLGELQLLSHESLSPIRNKDGKTSL